jgi:hypothetical protein
VPTAKRPPSWTGAPCAGHNVDNESVDADNENLRTQFIARRLSIRIDHAGFGLNRQDRLIDPSSRLSGKHYTVKIEKPCRKCLDTMLICGKRISCKPWCQGVLNSRLESLRVPLMQVSFCSFSSVVIDKIMERSELLSHNQTQMAGQDNQTCRYLPW